MARSKKIINSTETFHSVYMWTFSRTYGTEYIFFKSKWYLAKYVSKVFVACKALEIDSQPQKPRLVSKLGLLRGVGLEAVVESSNTAGIWHHADSTADCSDPNRRGCTGKIRPGLKGSVLSCQRHATVRTELISAPKILDLGNGSS